MFDDPDLYKEAELAAQRHGWSSPGMTGNIYRLLHAISRGEMTREQAVERSEILDWQLARRQTTWLKRDKNITWLPKEDIASWTLAQLLR
jgi:tRNA A37 N6-isopentenylltransferase MiaA